MKTKEKKRKGRRKAAFWFVNTNSVVVLLHQLAPRWGQMASNLYELEAYPAADLGSLPQELARFVAAGGKLNDLAKAAVEVFLQQARAFERVGPEVQSALSTQLSNELAARLSEYRTR